MSKKITLKKLLENEKKYNKLEKKVNKLMIKTDRQENNYLILHVIMNFITMLCLAFFISASFGKLLFLISFGTLFFSFITAVIHFMSINSLIYPNSYKIRMFAIDTKETEDFCKKNKEIIHLYTKKRNVKLHYELLKEKLNSSTKNELKENTKLIEDYCEKIKNVENKIEIKNILSKKAKEEEKSLIKTQEEIKTSLNILQRI